MTPRGLGLVFAEQLEGALQLASSARQHPMQLALRGRAPLLGFWRGEPAALTGRLTAPGLIDETEVQGVLRFSRARAELTYELASVARSAELALAGTKRGLFADPYAAFTTLPLTVRRAGSDVGRAVLRFDARGGLRKGLGDVSLAWR